MDEHENYWAELIKVYTFTFKNSQSMKVLNFVLFTMIVLLISCKKDDAETKIDHPFVPMPTPINIDNQWLIYKNGQAQASLPDSQWQNRYLNAVEMNLFNLVDTADLSGTASAKVVPNAIYPLYPNPYTTDGQIQFFFQNQFAGQIILKYVVVDNMTLPLTQGVIRLQAKSFSNGTSSTHYALLPNVPNGRYRLYYSLSANGDEHFFRSWGNIQRGN